MDDQSRPNTSSKSGLVLTVLIVAGIVGFLAGRATAPAPAPLPCPPTPLPAPTPQPSGVATNPCTDPGIKNISVNAQGAPSCDEAWLWTTSNDQAVWNAPTGSTLIIAFKDPGIFTLQSSPSAPNTVSSGAPAPSAPHNTPFPYYLYVYGRGTPTPGPRTPTPSISPLGHIIIKP